MESVLIVSKTSMKYGVCVSGLMRGTNRSVRLIGRGRNNQPIDTKFEIGQIWKIGFREINTNPPHVEDIMVVRQQYDCEVINMRETLEKRVQIWAGAPSILFDGLLILENISAYISQDGGIPKQSTGYWKPDRELVLNSRNGKHRYSINYRVSDGNGFCIKTLFIPYVGFVDPISIIPKGTLLRVSLARWWKPNGVDEERCYLQLSGWYL